MGMGLGGTRGSWWVQGWGGNGGPGVPMLEQLGGTAVAWGVWGAVAHTSRPPIPAGTRATAPPGPPVYVDLAYLPGSWSARTVDEEFFRRVRSLCYVVSGDDHLKEGVLRPLLDALLAGKHQWGTDTQVRAPPQSRT